VSNYSYQNQPLNIVPLYLFDIVDLLHRNSYTIFKPLVRISVCVLSVVGPVEGQKVSFEVMAVTPVASETVTLFE
jgi:hypothetical protein